MELVVRFELTRSKTPAYKAGAIVRYATPAYVQGACLLKSNTGRSLVNKVADSALFIIVTFWYVSHKHPFSVSLYTIAGRLGVLFVFFEDKSSGE